MIHWKAMSMVVLGVAAAGVRGEGSWGLLRIWFKVTPAPTLGKCSLTPQDAKLVGYETHFLFECPVGEGEEDDELEYKVFYTSPGEAEGSTHLAYEGHRPRREGLLLPAGTWDVHVEVENKFFMRSKASLGTFTLDDSAPLDTGMVEGELENIKAMVRKGDTRTAVAHAGLVALAVKALPQEGHLDIQYLNDIRASVLQVLNALPSQTNDEIRNTLLAIDTLVTPTTASPGAKVQRKTVDILAKLSLKLLQAANKSDTPIPEEYLHKDSTGMLKVVDNLMQISKKAPAHTGSEVMSRHMSHRLQNTMSTVTDILLQNREPGEMVNLSTPNIEVKAWKVDTSNIVGQKLDIQGVELKLPKTLKDRDVVSFSAVATTMNPRLEEKTQFSSNFLNVSIHGPKTEKRKVPLIYRFPRTQSVSLGEGSPNLAAFKLPGEAHCVRHDNTLKLFGWRVISKTATMTVQVPAGGRALIKVNTVFSKPLAAGTLRINIGVSNQTLGRVCWPALKEASYSNIKIKKSTSGNDVDEEFWIENSRPNNVVVSLTFLIAYSNLTVIDVDEKCDAALARRMPPAISVDMDLKLVQMTAQCVVYDADSKRFVPDSSCIAYPEPDYIRCECMGASLHTTLALPPTNNIELGNLPIDLEDNPLPVIFCAAVGCMFGVLCLVALLEDRRDQRRLAPLADSAKAGQPVKHNIFMYTSRFRYRPGTQGVKFSVTLRGNSGRDSYNTYICPGASLGSMLHLVHHSRLQVGRVQEVAVVVRHPSARWHVSRVVVSDAVEREVVLFPFNCWVSMVTKTSARLSEADRNCWRENFFVRIAAEVMATIPLLMLLLPGRVRQRKLDYMLTYALATAIWALLHLWLYEVRHPLYRPDDCLLTTLSPAQEALNSLFRFGMNFLLTMLVGLLVEGTIRASLMYREKKSKDPRDLRVYGLFPLPHWCRLLVRGLAFCTMVIIITFLVLMSYMLSKSEFNFWMVDIGQAFLFQIVSRALRVVVVGVVSLPFHLPSSDKFIEEAMNPEGQKAVCPECRVSPREALHHHFRRHLSPAPAAGPVSQGSAASPIMKQDSPLFPL